MVKENHSYRAEREALKNREQGPDRETGNRKTTMTYKTRRNFKNWGPRAIQRKIEKGKIVTGCRAETEKLKNRNREPDR